MKQKSNLLVAVAVVIIMLFTAGAIGAKDWKKTDFDKLAGEDRTFFVSSLQLAVNVANFQRSLDEELGFLLKNKDNTIPASIAMDDLKKSIEHKFGIIADSTDFGKSYEERMKNGFFGTEPNYNGNIVSYDWVIPNNKNRIAISIYLFKIGSRIQKNKAQITIELLRYNDQTSGYDILSTYKSKRVDWKKQTEIYEIIKTNCIFK